LVFDIGGRGDQSFNDSAAAGLDKARADFNITATEAAANVDGSNREELLALASDEADLVFGIGFLFNTPMFNVASDVSDTNFAIIDDPVDIDFDGVSDAPDNTAALIFAEEQGSFLVGAAAALNSTTGKVGFIGGVNIPLITAFEAGFRAGALEVNPAIEFDVQYISQPPDFTGFNDPASGKVIGQSMYEGGSDVVYHAAGGSGSGLFAAAKEYSEGNNTQVWAIGVDSDQWLTAGDAQDYVLTSMLKRVDVSVYNTIEAQVNGTFAGGVQLFNLAIDGVGYSTSGGFVDDIASQLDAFKADIISGAIVVTRDPADYGG
jgi:basic membrane protein A